MVNLEEHKFTYGVGGAKTTSFLAAGPKDGPLIVFVHGWPAIAKTWKSQLETFASLGFRAVAPDMPGYGGSTATKNAEDYSLESINSGMLALLAHLARDEAIWIGHDWGCGAVWSFAAHYPEHCVAAAGLTVPYRVLELGLEEELKTVNRDMYPEDEFPYAQWDYQRFYQLDFERATKWFDSDIPASVRILYSRGDPARLGTRAFTCSVVRDGGWFRGIEKPDPKWRDIHISKVCLDEEMYQDVVAAMEKTGFWGADAWYSNHERNRAYAFNKWKNEGYLHMPTLFIEAKFDTICDTVNSRLAEPQRKYCTNLTEVSIDAGHWVAQEKPAEVNGAIARWLVESCREHWPGYWARGHITTRL